MVERNNEDEGNGDGRCSLGQFRLFGVKYPSQVTESNGTITLNTAVFNVVKSGEGITGQTYDNSSGQGANTGLEAAINNASYDAPYPYYVTAGGTYHQGAHTGSGTTGGLDGNTNSWKGEWIQADLGQLIYPDYFAIYAYNAINECAILGSKDGLIWMNYKMGWWFDWL